MDQNFRSPDHLRNTIDWPQRLFAWHLSAPTEYAALGRNKAMSQFREDALGVNMLTDVRN